MEELEKVEIQNKIDKLELLITVDTAALLILSIVILLQ